MSEARHGSSPSLAALAVALCLAAAAPTGVAAQEREPAVFADATGVVWGVATLEVSFALIPLMLEVSDCRSWGCLGVAAITTLAGLCVSVGVGIVGQVTDAPPDIPMAIHQTAIGAMMGYGLTQVTSDMATDGDSHLPGTIGAIVGGIGAGFYAAWNRDHLSRNPDATLGAHLLNWGPAFGAIVGLGLGELLRLVIHGEGRDDGLVNLMTALGAATAYGIALGVTEGAR